MTPHELELVRKRYPVGPGVARVNGDSSPTNPVQDSKPEPIVRDEPLAAASSKEGGSTRVKVRVISYRRRLLDADNLAGGSKFIIDALRYAGFIRDDSPDDVELSFAQVKVGSKETEDTAVIISRIPDISPTEAAQIYAKTMKEI